MHQILWEDASWPCRDDHVTKSRNQKLILVTSSDVRLGHKCVDLDDYNRYLNQIWYRGHVTECAKFTWLKNGGGRHLVFRKMSITPNWIELFAQNLVGRCVTAMRRWHMTKSRNRKFIRVTSLNECTEHRCDDVKAYKCSQLTDFYFKPMQNSPVRAIV